MPDPEAKAAPRVLRSNVYGSAISDGGSDNNFYVGKSSMANGRDWQMVAVTETIATEISSLTPAVRSQSDSFVNLPPPQPRICARTLIGCVAPPRRNPFAIPRCGSLLLSLSRARSLSRSLSLSLFLLTCALLVTSLHSNANAI